jgi:putative MATE family efflux protein
MSRAEKYNLVEGSIVDKLFSVAAPIITTQVFQMAYNLTDMFWLGRLSSDAVAASGTAGLYLWLSFAFFMFGRMGAEIGVSQNLGRKDVDTARVYAQNSIAIGLAFGITLAVIFVNFSGQFIGLFGIQEANVAQDATDYLRIVSFGMPFTFVTAAISGTFNGAGNSRITLLINGFGLTMNMILDPLLIFTAGLGIHGAAYASIIAQPLTTILAIIMLLKYKNRPFDKIKLIIRPKVEIIKQIVKWVTPIALESFLFTVLSMTVVTLIATYSSAALAAARVGSQIESLTWLIAGGFASAMTAFTGQNFGAGKWSRIHKGFRISTAMMAFWGLLIMFLLYFGGGVLYKVFIPNEPEVVELGVVYLQILALVQIPACLEGVAAGVFRGKGKTVPPSVASISSNILRVVLAYGSVYFTNLGLMGIWWAFAISAAVRGTWIFVWYILHSRNEPKDDVVVITPQTQGVQ